MQDINGVMAFGSRIQHKPKFRDSIKKTLFYLTECLSRVDVPEGKAIFITSGKHEVNTLHNECILLYFPSDNVLCNGGNYHMMTDSDHVESDSRIVLHATDSLQNEGK